MIKLKQKGLLFALVLVPFVSGCAVLVAAGAAGVGAGVAMSQDRRTSGTYVEDEAIETKSAQRITEKYGDNVHANITSYNRNVLLTGEAPTDTAKADIGDLVGRVEQVRSVINEMTVGTVSTFPSRSNDTLITSKVKGRFLDGGDFRVNHVKVVTENGVVYLLGLVNQKEAESAVRIASSTSGVRKVVKVFEYTG